MEIIPVIDLMGGQVVHARHGCRDTYRPLSTPLCRSSDPFAVVAAFLSLHPFTHLYIADLDALMGRESQRRVIEALAARYPNLRLWVDAGWPAPKGDWTAVVGTESLNHGDWLRFVNERRDWILSLDFFDGMFKGPPQVLEQAEWWPERVIVMTTARVGSLAGPDWAQLAQFRRLAPECGIIAAGGVRDLADIRRLERMGISGALVASALHEGQLTLG